MHVFEASTEVKSGVSRRPLYRFPVSPISFQLVVQVSDELYIYTYIGVEYSGYIGHPLVRLHTYSLCCNISLIDFKVY